MQNGSFYLLCNTYIGLGPSSQYFLSPPDWAYVCHVTIRDFQLPLTRLLRAQDPVAVIAGPIRPPGGF